jgi:hypothetical protein
MLAQKAKRKALAARILDKLRDNPNFIAILSAQRLDRA